MNNGICEYGNDAGQCPYHGCFAYECDYDPEEQKRFPRKERPMCYTAEGMEIIRQNWEMRLGK